MAESHVVYYLIYPVNINVPNVTSLMAYHCGIFIHDCNFLQIVLTAVITWRLLQPTIVQSTVLMWESNVKNKNKHSKILKSLSLDQSK